MKRVISCIVMITLVAVIVFGLRLISFLNQSNWYVASKYPNGYYLICERVGWEPYVVELAQPTGPDFEEDKDPLAGLMIVGQNKKRLLLFATSRFFSYDIKTRTMAFLGGDVMDFAEDESGEILFCDVDNDEYRIDWQRDHIAIVPTGRKILRYPMGYNTEFVELEGECEEFYKAQEARRKGKSVPRASWATPLEDEPDCFPIRSNGEVYGVSLHLPTPWAPNDSIFIGNRIAYVAKTDSLTAYHLGEVAYEYQLPTGSWTIIYARTEFRRNENLVQDIDTNKDGFESLSEIKEAIVDARILLFNTENNEVFAVRDGKLSKIADNIIECCLTLGAHEDYQNALTDFYWIDPRGKVYVNRWEENNESTLLEGGIGIHHTIDGRYVGYVVRPDDQRADIVIGGLHVVTTLGDYT